MSKSTRLTKQGPSKSSPAKAIACSMPSALSLVRVNRKSPSGKDVVKFYPPRWFSLPARRRWSSMVSRGGIREKSWRLLVRL